MELGHLGLEGYYYGLLFKGGGLFCYYCFTINLSQIDNKREYNWKWKLIEDISSEQTKQCEQSNKTSGALCLKTRQLLIIK